MRGKSVFINFKKLYFCHRHGATTVNIATQSLITLSITTHSTKALIVIAFSKMGFNGAVCFKKCKQLFEYQHLLLLRDVWWSKF